MSAVKDFRPGRISSQEYAKRKKYYTQKCLEEHMSSPEVQAHLQRQARKRSLRLTGFSVCIAVLACVLLTQVTSLQAYARARVVQYITACTDLTSSPVASASPHLLLMRNSCHTLCTLRKVTSSGIWSTCQHKASRTFRSTVHHVVCRA